MDSSANFSASAKTSTSLSSGAAAYTPTNGAAANVLATENLEMPAGATKETFAPPMRADHENTGGGGEDSANYDAVIAIRQAINNYNDPGKINTTAPKPLDYLRQAQRQFEDNAEVTLEILFQQLYQLSWLKQRAEAEAQAVETLKHYYRAQANGQNLQIIYSSRAVPELVTEILNFAYRMSGYEHIKNPAEFIAQEFPAVREKGLWEKLCKIVSPFIEPMTPVHNNFNAGDTAAGAPRTNSEPWSQKSNAPAELAHADTTRATDPAVNASPPQPGPGAGGEDSPNYKAIIEIRENIHKLCKVGSYAAVTSGAVLDYLVKILPEHINNAETSLEILYQQLTHLGYSHNMQAAEALAIKTLKHYYRTRAAGEELKIIYSSYSVPEAVVSSLELTYRRTDNSGALNAAEFVAQVFPAIKEPPLWGKLSKIIDSIEKNEPRASQLSRKTEKGSAAGTLPDAALKTPYGAERG